MSETKFSRNAALLGAPVPIQAYGGFSGSLKSGAYLGSLILAKYHMSHNLNSQYPP